MTDPRAVAGAEAVRLLYDACNSPQVKATLSVNGGVEIGYCGTLAGFRHFLATLETQVDTQAA